MDDVLENEDIENLLDAGRHQMTNPCVLVLYTLVDNAFHREVEELSLEDFLGDEDLDDSSGSKTEPQRRWNLSLYCIVWMSLHRQL